MTDQEEDQAELAGLRAAVVELRRENALLRRGTIDLREQLAGERTRAAQLALVSGEGVKRLT